MINVSKSKQFSAQFSAQWHTTTSTQANNLHYLRRRLLIQISTNIMTLIAYDLKVNGDNKSGPFTFQRGIKHICTQFCQSSDPGQLAGLGTIEMDN